MQKNFEVMRFIQQNGDFHIVLDSVLGESLSEYMNHNVEIEKEKIFEWINQIIKEMVAVEWASAIKEYRYLMPFCIVIKQNEKIALLNLKSKVNQKRVEKILSKPASGVFFPEDDSYNDIYSFGKTLQYIFAHVDLEPSLTRQEEKKIRKIISKCLNTHHRRAYQSFEEILTDFSKINKKMNIIFKFIVIIVAIVLGIILLDEKFFCYESGENDEAYMSAALTYFANLGNYEKSEELFSQVKNIPTARYYQEMSVYMQGESQFSDIEMEDMLEDLQEKSRNEMKYEEKYCILKVYERLNTESAEENLVRLSEEILASPDWYRDEEEIREILEQAK